MRAAGVLALAVLLAGFGSPGDAFAKQVKRYVRLHQKLVRQLPRLKTAEGSAAIENHQQALARKLRAARADSRQGEIFTPEVTRQFRQFLQAALAPAEADRVRTSLQNAEPVHAVLQVNEPLPAGAALQSPPPTLLMSFPRLPPELDYRVIGKSLVLRDTIANVIVDFIPDWLPGPK
jgi:hypothetical protein